MVATASRGAMDCWQMAQISSGEDCQSWNMEWWESHWICPRCTEPTWVPVSRSWRTCAWEGREPRLDGAGGGMERDITGASWAGQTGENAARLLGCKHGAAKACHETSRRSSDGVVGRMAIVLHDETLTGGGAMASCGAERTSQVAREGGDCNARMARARLRLSAMSWS